MAIRTGIGVGAAQIADTSNIMNAYGRQIAQQQKAQAVQAEREAKAAAKYEEDLADLMASVKTEGARDVDVPDITNAYNEIKEYYSQSGSLKDKDKPLFRAELMNRVKNLNEFAFRSNKLSKDILGISGDIAKNEWDYDPNAVTEIKTIAQTPLKKLGGMAVIDPLRYKRQADPNLIIKALDDVYKLGEANATPSGQIVDRSGLKYSVKKADPTFINNALVQRIQNDPQALQSLSVLYRRTTGDNNPTTEKLTGFLKDQYETRYKYDYLGNAMQPRVGRGGGSGSGSDQDKYTYRQQVITGALGNDPDSINKIKAALPPGSVITPGTSVRTKDSKGGYNFLKITIPQGFDERGNPLPKLEETIEASRGEGVIKLNRILNTYTGENISDSKLGIKGGKLAGQQIAVNIPKPTKTKPDVIQNGYTYRWNGTKYVPVE
jgi:hypothetical protein